MYILLTLNNQIGGEYMVDLEELIIFNISSRFKELRETKYQKLSPDLIANGQKSAILRIEKGENTTSRNFISDTLLDNYSQYFIMSKKDLIFGTNEDLEKDLMLIFYEMIRSIVLSDFIEKPCTFVKNSTLESKVHKAVLNLMYSFADFGRWYDLRRIDTIGTEDEWENEMIDFGSMSAILWKICKKKIVRSFEEKVIYLIFNEPDEKFHFNRINEKFNKWLLTDFANIIVPEIVEKLKSNSIFKMGFMVKTLIDEFLVFELPSSYLKDIPLEEFYPPVKSFHFHLEEKDRTDENLNQMASEMFRFLSQKKETMSIEDLKKLDEESYFQGVSGVTDQSQPFIDGTRKVSAEAFLNHVISTPDLFDSIHELNRKERKIPGILTVNSHASNLLQIKISEVIESMIDDLVRYQNIFINCIKGNELEDFAK